MYVPGTLSVRSVIFQKSSQAQPAKGQPGPSCQKLTKMSKIIKTSPHHSNEMSGRSEVKKIVFEIKRGTQRLVTFRTFDHSDE